MMFLLDKSRTSLEELKEVSHTAQEAKLDRELLRFEDMLELFFADKDMFLENLYWRLKQVTSLWRSWRVQRLRDVPVTHLVSTKQVENLIYWEKNIAGKKMAAKLKVVKKRPDDMLVRFLQACKESRQLFRQFFSSIYTPLHQLFADEKAASIAKELERILKQWSSLHVPGPINHRMLSAESSEAVHNMKITNKPRDTQFNLILRLVPDFAVKGYKALFLARQWRNMLGSSGYWRELKFIQSKKQWASRSEPSDSSVCSSTFFKLEKELSCFGEGKMTESKGRVIGIGDRTASRDYEVLGTNMKFHSLREADKRFACSSSFNLDTNKQRREPSRMDLKRKQVKVPRIKTEILGWKLRWRDTAEKTVEEPLLHTLDVSRTKCWGSRKQISKEKQQKKFADHQYLKSLQRAQTK